MGRKASRHEEVRAADAEGRAVRVLIVARSRQERDRLHGELRAVPWEVEKVASVRSARLRLRDEDFDLLLVDAGHDGAIELLREVDGDGPAVVLVAHEPSLEQGVEAMRDGASDYIVGGMIGGALIERLERAIERGRERRRREREQRRLRAMCRSLDGVRQEMFEQVGSLCDDLVSAYSELSEQIDVLDTMHEFQSMVRRELDVESLLRIVLEYVLAKGGSTNAAIYLPDTCGEYSLGAYVNYDCPRDSGEAMLDLLADVIPERFCDRPELVHLRSDAELTQRLGEDAHWLLGQGAVVMSCFAEGECLAVVALFRDRRQPFDSAFLRTLSIIREGFAQQLARVIRVHHRAEPDSYPGDGHGGFEDPGIDGLDMAA